MQQTARELAVAMRDGCLGTRVTQLHRVVARRFDQALRPLGLTLPQLEMLGVLMMRGTLKPAEIADALAVERSTISRNLFVSEQRGWIAVESSPGGRTATAAITPDGVAVLASARSAWADTQRLLIELLGTDAPATMDVWLKSLGPT